MLALLAVSSGHREPAGDVQTGAKDEADRFVAEMLRWGVLPKLAVGGTAAGGAGTNANGDGGMPDADRNSSATIALGLELARLPRAAVALATVTYVATDRRAAGRCTNSRRVSS